jgi:hypothetical protein
LSPGNPQESSGILQESQGDSKDLQLMKFRMILPRQLMKIAMIFACQFMKIVMISASGKKMIPYHKEHGWIHREP